MSTELIRRFRQGTGPLYQRVVEAVEGAVADGTLRPGDRLPTHRDLARDLGVDLTTVTRAYRLLRERGLIDAGVGRGSFVRGDADETTRGLIDLSMNIPPQPAGGALKAALAATTAKVLKAADPAVLMAYRPIGGGSAERAAGARWLEPVLGPVDPRRVLVCGGAQAALTALLMTLARPKATVLVDPLTYPGLLAVARRLDVRLVAVAGDGEGMTPEALDQACRAHAPAAVYLIPTLQNPTTATLSPPRRRALAEVARRHGVQIVEDDAYGLLPATPLDAIAQVAPERTWYVATLAKTLSPGLRVAYVVAPDEAGAETLAVALRAVAGMAAPLNVAVATAWIREGVAADLLAGVRAEAAARSAVAREILPQARGGEHGIHLWLDLPAGWNRRALTGAARGRGLALMPADAFATDETPPNGVRLSLGAARDRAALAEGLRSVADILDGASAPVPGHVV